MTINISFIKLRQIILSIVKYCNDNDYWPSQGFDYLDKKSERSIHIMNEDIL